MKYLTAQELADSLQIFEGTVVTSDSLLPVPNAHIISKFNHWGTISNATGRFRIFVTEGDSVLFTSIGFSPMIIYINDTLISQFPDAFVLMQKDTALLNEVIIRPYWDYETFKQLIIRMEPLDISQFYPEWEGTGLLYKDARPTSIGGPIQALYNVFNKDARLQRKLIKNRKDYNKIMMQMGRPEDTIPAKPEHMQGWPR